MVSNLEVQGLNWFHQHISRHQAEALLMQNGENGSYLLRESSTNIGEYSLSVRSLNAVKHFQIGWDGRVFKFGMGRFNNLEDFIKHFQNQPLIGGESGVLTVLRYPYPRDVEEPIRYDTIRIHGEWASRKTKDDKKCSTEPESINSKEGFLTKQGGLVKTWKARWFLLCKNELRYYKAKGDEQPIRTLDLTKCTAVEEDFSSGKPNSFRIDMPSRNFFISASTKADQNEWISVLQWKVRKNNNQLAAS